MTAYRPREVQPLALAQRGDWRIKRYAILSEGASIDPIAVDAALEAGARALQAAEAESGDIPHQNLGFQLIHFGEHAVWAPIFWWVLGDNLSSAMFRAPLADPTAFADMAATGLIGCVWEMGVVDFERRTWIETMLKAEGDQAAARDAYLSRRLTGLV